MAGFCAGLIAYRILECLAALLRQERSQRPLESTVLSHVHERVVRRSSIEVNVQRTMTLIVSSSSIITAVVIVGACSQSREWIGASTKRCALSVFALALQTSSACREDVNIMSQTFFLIFFIPSVVKMLSLKDSKTKLKTGFYVNLLTLSQQERTAKGDQIELWIATDVFCYVRNAVSDERR